MGRSSEDPWFVYFLWSPTTLKFYIGVSNNPEKRLLKHNGILKGGARFTRGGQPWRIVYVEGSFAKGDALRRERALKKLGRQKKIDFLVKGAWNPLSSRFERLKGAKMPVFSCGTFIRTT